jgi:hypothetical protein
MLAIKKNSTSQPLAFQYGHAHAHVHDRGGTTIEKTEGGRRIWGYARVHAIVLSSVFLGILSGLRDSAHANAHVDSLVGILGREFTMPTGKLRHHTAVKCTRTVCFLCIYQC